MTLGLLAALAWGLADYLAQPASRHLGAVRASLAAQAFGAAALLVALWLRRDLPFPADGAAWAWALGAAVLGTVGALAFYEALRVGTLAIIAPITGSYGAVTALLAWLGGQHLGPLGVLGLIVALLAVVLVSGAGPDASRTAAGLGRARGVGWAVLSAAALGACFWVMGFGLMPRLGGLPGTWAMRLCSLGLTALTLLLLRPSRPAARPTSGWPGLRYAAASGVLSTAAVAFTALGLGRGQDAVVTVLGSLSVVITTVLALAVGRERLSSPQWAGVVLAVAGILLTGL
ncbi:drug/metabolite transporter (DMT)-like permease [Deinococcus metalli]|uniref:Drug/metabolite transporter (DMT)-like permease n=1 Tax=Deinococcus metalli TaxID=1141878 RepID=A0A7W8KDB4_9DEIO|nr:EamA family transporter [Deinococcus metalli]MBB5374963.1 drug/metabolite transporter (DMT)-like permease [Deinococcus metalli]